MKLTQAQYARIAKLPEDTKVVGTDRGDPLVEHYPSGRIVRVLAAGKLTPARKDAVLRVEARKGWRQ